MSELTLTKTRLSEGVWYGILRAEGALNSVPDLVALYHGAEMSGLDLTPREQEAGWDVRLNIPVTAIGDGVQTFVITERISGEKLETVSVLAGEALADDIRAEVDLLRAELDMLKRAFRRHCVETA